MGPRSLPDLTVGRADAHTAHLEGGTGLGSRLAAFVFPRRTPPPPCPTTTEVYGTTAPSPIPWISLLNQSGATGPPSSSLYEPILCDHTVGVGQGGPWTRGAGRSGGAARRCDRRPLLWKVRVRQKGFRHRVGYCAEGQPETRCSAPRVTFPLDFVHLVQVGVHGGPRDESPLRWWHNRSKVVTHP